MLENDKIHVFDESISLDEIKENCKVLVETVNFITITLSIN